MANDCTSGPSNRSCASLVRRSVLLLWLWRRVTRVCAAASTQPLVFRPIWRPGW
jgi:hypothetical protein